MINWYYSEKQKSALEGMITDSPILKRDTFISGTNTEYTEMCITGRCSLWDDAKLVHQCELDPGTTSKRNE